MTNALDSEMVPMMDDRRGPLPGLGAVGPIRSLKSRLMLFGQFVGDWDILPPRSQWKGSEPETTGEARFR
jgi:hypothetical protein